jgi:hypothetical protein
MRHLHRDEKVQRWAQEGTQHFRDQDAYLSLGLCSISRAVSGLDCLTVSDAEPLRKEQI